MKPYKIRKISKSLEFLNIFASGFGLYLFLILLIRSLNYWTNNYPSNMDLDSQMFYIAILVAIITSVSQWISGRLTAIVRSIQTLRDLRESNLYLKTKGGSNGERNNKRRTRRRRRQT